MSSIKALAIAKATGGSGGGGEITLETLNVDANATYNAPSGKAYKKVIADVPNSYAAGDEGKVVSGGALVAQTTKNIAANGTVDTTTNNEVVVAVQPNLQQKTVTENGTVTADQGYDGLSSVVVNVSDSIPSIPSDYQEVEYLICDGSAYISEYAVKMQTGDTVQGYASLDSSVASSTNDCPIGGGGSSTFSVKFYKGVLSYTDKLSGTPVQDIQYDTKYEFTGVFTGSVADLIIGRHMTNQVHKGKIWAITLRNGRTNAIYRRYVPCYRKSDNAVGFFEVIRGNFKTSGFVAGPDVT